MSNVAIKLVAVTGVIGLGVLMFLQAQKGIQSTSNQNEVDQYVALEGENASVTEATPESGTIPSDQVPAELSELAAKNAHPLKAEETKQSELPFAPNRKSEQQKIKLTSGSEDAVFEAQQEPPSEFEPDNQAELVPAGKGLDFRETPKMATPALSENPFKRTPQPEPATPAEKKATETVAEPAFDAGPQFGPAMAAPATADSKGPKTEVPPRETLVTELDSSNPFESQSSETKSAKTPAPASVKPEPEPFNLGPEPEPATKENPFPEESSPAAKLETGEPPFELKPEPVPETPAVDANPFMTTPEEKKAAPQPAAPAVTPAAPKVEPEFNPFSNEPQMKAPAPQPELKSAKEENTPSEFELQPKKTPAPAEPTFTINPAPTTPAETPEQPVTPASKEQADSDVVVIKKRQPEDNPSEPSLFAPEGKTADKMEPAAPQPIAITPATEPKPLNLVEGSQPETGEPARLNMQQKVQSPKMTIQKIAPPEAVLGQPFIYHVLVKNSGTTSAREVVVEDRIPSGAKLTGTIPRAEQIKDRIIWRLGAMGPGEEKKISIRVIPEKPGQIGSVATVNFVTEVASETKITSPQLSIKSDQPSAVKPGEVTVVNYTITNTGSGDAKNVYVRSIIPPQFSHPGGDDLEYHVGVIPAGETREVQLQLKAVKPGAGKNVSSVVGDGNLKAETTVPLKVIGNSEEFLITRKGPKNRYLGRAGVYENTIANNTEQTIKNISIFESVPPGMKFISASGKGQFDTVRRVVQWDIAELAGGMQQVFSIELEPTEVGKKVSTVQVVTGNNSKFSANLQSEVNVIGQPLLKVETSELKGPLEVGEKMSLQVQLVNQGSAPANNVEFRVKIPQEMVFVAAKGPARYKQAGSFVIFESAQVLAPQQSLDFELTLAAKNKGDARVLVTVQSQQMEKPLNQEEAIPILDKLQ
ncbi:Large cysteine-rich periplasmic protein OmcB precursor [Gimesia panareensis]|uniref:Large cysteine-rich periplasmic protein OmcB n=1 Tax=Gimesia panareensis TaxID=2527978 RepID=A0A518FIR7_9PLAN|nr:DUF11 domain-containing protein [Gimesia panareensis]QDV16245.1 Large cysteine-rich periplasmic protein OmcB precursor [Gimesia panareensis]